jgi:hypothetical protein
MAYNTEVITAAEVKALAINDTAFDEAYFEDYIIVVQRKYLKPTLGDDYYDEILTEVAGATLTADNTIIVENFIKPMLAHYIVYEVFPKIHTQVTNMGSMENYTEFSRQNKSFEYSQNRDFFISQGDNWRKDMIEYIKDAQDNDATKYPLFDSCVDKVQVNKRGIIFY